MPNSVSGNSNTTVRLSPSERSRLYQRRFPVPRKSRKVWISDEKIWSAWVAPRAPRWRSKARSAVKSESHHCFERHPR